MNKERIFTILFYIITFQLNFCLTCENCLPVSNYRLKDTLCLTESCIHTASDLLNYMNQSVDPCDNFYEFSCGKFLNSTILLNNEEKVNHFETLQDKILKQIHFILNEPITPNDAVVAKKSKIFYKSCRKLNNIDEGYTALLNISKELGGWPVIEGEQRNETDFNWTDNFSKFNKIVHLPSFLLRVVRTRDQNGPYISLDGPYFELSYDEWTKSRDNEAEIPYWKKMIDVAVKLGAKREQAEQELMESFKFEIQLYNITMHDDKSEELYTDLTLSDLIELYPTIPWKDIFTRTNFEEMYNNGTARTRKSFIKNLIKLMEITPKRVQANYLMWRAIFRLRLTLDLIIEKNVYNDDLSSWKKCIHETYEKFTAYLSNVYLQRFVQSNIKPEVNNLIGNITKQFSKNLQKTSWYNDTSRKIAEETLSKIIFEVIQPDESLDEKELESIYEILELDENNYLKNTILFDKSIPPKPFWRAKWPNVAKWNYFQVITPKTSYSWDKIAIPAAILQRPFFDLAAPQYMNYGTMGQFIAHQIIHGFYPFDFTVKSSTPPTAELFFTKLQPLIEQNTYYRDVYSVAEVAETVFFESFADNGGIKVAYQAYNDWLEKNGPEMKLPKLPYTNKQMFWISAAYGYCSKGLSRFLDDEMETDHHAPSEFRILTMLSNTPEFSNDFNCPVGSRMNPEDKFTGW